MNFFVLSRQWAEFSASCPFFWRVCYNCILRVHSNTLEPKNVFHNIYFFNIFGQKVDFFETLSEKPRRGCQKGILQVQWKFFGTTFFKKIILLVSFGHWAKLFRGFARIVSALFSKLDSHFQTKLSRKTFFSAKFTIWYFLLKIEQKNFGWRSVKTQPSFETAFYFSRGSIWRIFFEKCLHLLRTFFGSFPVNEEENFGRPVKTEFFVSIEKIWKKN